MNWYLRTGVALLLAIPMLGAACFEDTKKSKSSDDDSDDGGGGWVASDDDGGTGGGLVGSGPSGTSTSSTGGSSCMPGGSSCETFDQCCSGVCDNQTCTSCGSDGDSCDDGCCVGLTCYAGTCGTCQHDGSSCQFASDCCSNICDQGVCAQDPSCNVGDCSTCLQSGCAQNACYSELSKFQQNPDASSYVECIDPCNDNACYDACAEEFPTADADYTALLTCMICDEDVCFDDCDGASVCN